MYSKDGQNIVNMVLSILMFISDKIAN